MLLLDTLLILKKVWIYKIFIEIVIVLQNFLIQIILTLNKNILVISQATKKQNYDYIYLVISKYYLLMKHVESWEIL